MTDIDRRDFVRRTAVMGAALTVPLPPSAFGNQLAVAPPTPRPATFELDEITIVQLQDDMRSGKRTARSIAEAYLARIGEIDGAGPRLNSVIETNPDALAIADGLDRERRAGRVRGPLHGFPCSSRTTSTPRTG